MARKASRRRTSLLIAVALFAAMIVAGSAATSSAEEPLLPSADTIVLETGAGSLNGFRYGSATQAIQTSPNQCRASLASSALIMVASTTAADNKGATVDPGKLGFVEDGLGSNAKGTGNGQECGRVDEGESLVLQFSDQVGRYAYAVDLDLEAKFDAVVIVEYLINGTPYPDYDRFVLTTNGSDSGPDSKYLDKYRVDAAPKNPDLGGILFNGIRITTESGSVSLEGGATWPNPAANRTVFHLIDALACGESTEVGGPYLADNPLAALTLGPSSKTGSECAIPVEITTDTPPAGYSQVVRVTPPTGFSWDGLGPTGIITVQWDVEEPDLAAIDRTLVQTTGGDVVIPWCADVIGVSQVSGEWYYELNPDMLYPDATGALDVCLVDQSTDIVWYDDDDNAGTPDVAWTQTTEIFYMWNDPILVRK